MTRLTTRTVRAIFTLALLLNLNLCTLQASDKPARILFVTQSAGFVHGSVKRGDKPLAVCERVMTELGISSKLFRVDCSQDVKADFTKDKLQHYDIVMFYTTGKLPIDDATLTISSTLGLNKRTMVSLEHIRRPTRSKTTSRTGT